MQRNKHLKMHSSVWMKKNNVKGNVPISWRSVDAAQNQGAELEGANPPPGSAPIAAPGVDHGAPPGSAPIAAPGVDPGAAPGAASGAAPEVALGEAPGEAPGEALGEAPGETSGAASGAAAGEAVVEAAGEAAVEASGAASGTVPILAPGAGVGPAPGWKHLGPVTGQTAASATIACLQNLLSQSNIDNEPYFASNLKYYPHLPQPLWVNEYQTFADIKASISAGNHSQIRSPLNGFYDPPPPFDVKNFFALPDGRMWSHRNIIRSGNGSFGMGGAMASNVLPRGIYRNVAGPVPPGIYRNFPGVPMVHNPSAPGIYRNYPGGPMAPIPFPPGLQRNLPGAGVQPVMQPNINLAALAAYGLGSVGVPCPVSGCRVHTNHQVAGGMPRGSVAGAVPPRSRNSNTNSNSNPDLTAMMLGNRPGEQPTRQFTNVLLSNVVNGKPLTTGDKAKLKQLRDILNEPVASQTLCANLPAPWTMASGAGPSSSTMTPSSSAPVAVKAEQHHRRRHNQVINAPPAAPWNDWQAPAANSVQPSPVPVIRIQREAPIPPPNQVIWGLRPYHQLPGSSPAFQHREENAMPPPEMRSEGNAAPPLQMRRNGPASNGWTQTSFQEE